MPETIGEGRCKGCGSALPEREPGRGRPWCTDNCRKRTWEREREPRGNCRDCDAPLGMGSQRRGHKRCRACYAAERRAEHEQRLDFVERLWNEGCTWEEMAAELGYAPGSKPGRLVRELRRRGRIGYRYKAYEQRVAA